MVTIETALEYAARGWAVLPLHSIASGRCTCGSVACASPAKHPRTLHGVKDASTDEAKVRGWWSKWPDANIGIATGPVSGIFVLDVDVRGTINGQETLAALQLQHEEPLPETLAAQTGGGGLHYFFEQVADTPAVRSGAGRLGKGLDVRGEGGYVVVPPSTHATTEVYRWQNEAPVAPAPEWLITLIAQPPLPKETGDEEAVYADLLAGVREGHRNDAAARLAGHYLGLGLPAVEVKALLTQWNTRNTPPMESEELDTVIASIARKELLKRGDADPVEGSDRKVQLQALSERFGVVFKDIVRVCGQEPYYVFFIEKNQVTLPAGDMATQIAWRRAITAAAERVPEGIGKKDPAGWAHFANLMMTTARQVEAGPEDSPASEVREWLEAYVEQLKYRKNGEVFHVQQAILHEGFIYVHPQALRNFVQSAFNVRLTRSKFFERLRYIGCTYIALHIQYKNKSTSTTRLFQVPKRYLRITL